MNRGTVLALVGLGLILSGLAVLRLSGQFHFDHGMSSALLIGGVLGLIVGLGLAINGVRMRSYYALPTFQEYKSQHPTLVGQGGQMKCYNCADLRRRMWRYALDLGPTKHMCLQCGTELYRS